MRKYAILAGVLLALALLLIIATHIDTNKMADDVTVTETVLAGDRDKAVDTMMAVEVQSMGYALYWKIQTKILDSGLETITAFANNDRDKISDFSGEAYKADRITLESDVTYAGFGSDGTIDLEYEAKRLGIPYEMALAAAKATPAGKEQTTLLHLNDYAAIFPMTLICNPKKHRIFNSGSDLIDYSYFQMPAPAGMFYAVEIGKNAKGDVNYVGSAPAEDTKNYTVDADGVIVGDTLYMAISSISAGTYYPEKIVSDIAPEQRGIHAIPLKENGEMRSVDLDHAKTVFRLDENERVIRMVYREEEDAFHLYTEDAGKLWFSVVDRETMTRKQKLYLMDKHHPLIRTYFDNGFTNDYSVILDGKGNFVLTAKGENPIKGNIMTLDLMENFVECMRMETLAWNYDGTRLAVAAVQLQSDEVRHSGCLLQIFDKTGLQYAGLYENSLEGDQLDRDMDADHLITPVTVGIIRRR